MISIIIMHYRIDDSDDILLNGVLKSFDGNDYEMIIADEKNR